MDVECRHCGTVNHIAPNTPASEYRCWHCISWLYDDDMASTKEE